MPNANPVEQPQQFALLRQRRFAPFFWAQFLGAANDNLFKFAFTVLVTFQLQVAWLPSSMAGLVIGAVFIAPFVLFSATSGQLADKYDKASCIRWVKTLEVLIALVAALGLLTLNVAVMLACVFLLGLHSTLFGPVKYAYLPEHLSERELTGGNGMVEMGTFVAILLGNLAGGLLIALPSDAWLQGTQAVAVVCVLLAVLGRLAAAAVPSTPAAMPQLAINWNAFSETARNLSLARQNIVVFRSMLGISWMWFVGAVLLTQFPSFARGVLNGNEQVASLLLVVFSLGIGLGSVACEWLSRRHVEIGLVPIGALGMTVFGVDLYFASEAVSGAQQALAGSSLQGVAAFVAQPAHWRVMADLFGLALSAGLYSVPMYALIQLRTPATHRARIIAANNILNAIFMIASSVLAGGLLALGASVPQVFLAVALANALVGAYVFLLVPEYLLRFVAYLASRLVYRLRIQGDEHIPTSGAAILVCNHVSFVDAVLLMAVSPRPIRFVMDHRIFAIPVLGWLFRLARAIPIASQKDNPKIYEAAFEAADQVLGAGDLLCIFPEGAITRDGSLQPFKGGVMKILERRPVPVVPMALQNLWGSYFSRVEGEAFAKPFRRGLFSRVGVVAGPAVAAAEVTPEVLKQRVTALLGETQVPAVAAATVP
jgi:1-acyl-sn-glycerol-3-phosphate acyltransferase